MVRHVHTYMVTHTQDLQLLVSHNTAILHIMIMSMPRYVDLGGPSIQNTYINVCVHMFMYMYTYTVNMYALPLFSRLCAENA